METDYKVLLFIFGSVVFLGFYAIKRSFDETQFYVEHGYHQNITTNAVWVK